MIHAALLASVLVLASAEARVTPKTPIQQCFETIDGATDGGGIPARRTTGNRARMRNAERACERELARIERLRPGTSEGPAKLFLTARILDRAATLALLAFNGVTTASHDVALANLYFRVAAGLPNQPASYRAAAVANVELTRVQLISLRPDLPPGPTDDTPVIAQAPCAKMRHIGACARPTPTVYTAYHTHN